MTALPILFEIADRTAHHLRDEGEARTRLTTQRKIETRGALHDFSPAAPPEIMFPPANAELWAGSVDGASARPFVLAGRGEGLLAWYIDGRPSETDDAGMPVWLPTLPGFYTITAVDESGRASRVRVRVLMGPS